MLLAAENKFLKIRNRMCKIITAISFWALLKIQISSQHFVAHKKYFLTYQLYAALPFFARASFYLEL